MPCTYCGADVSPERLEFGYKHCPALGCVTTWRKGRLESEFRLDLVPKQGLVYSFRTDTTVTTIGRSSGRSV